MTGILVALAFAALAADPEPLILQIRVVDGDGATHPAGTRSIKGITVEVTDEAGSPVPNAAVSFRLPEDGASGMFSNGTRTEIVTTLPNGRATAWGMRWNKLPGTVAVRVTAAKGETRAGAIVQQRLAEPTSASGYVSAQNAAMPARIKMGPPRKRWVWLSALAAAAGGGLAFGAFRQGSSPANPAQAAVGISIGNPTILVGK